MAKKEGKKTAKTAIKTTAIKTTAIKTETAKETKKGAAREEVGKPAGDLYEFYGTECPHCIRMRPLLEKLEKELGIKFRRFEVWHNPENAKLMEQYDQSICGGVPFYYNAGTGDAICGETSYQTLKNWALKKKP